MMKTTLTPVSPVCCLPATNSVTAKEWKTVRFGWGPILPFSWTDASGEIKVSTSIWPTPSQQMAVKCELVVQDWTA